MTEELKPLPCPFEEWFESRFGSLELAFKDGWKGMARETWDAALTRSPAWRDVESAPRDGTRLLFFDGVQIKVGHWLDRSYTEKRTVSETQDRIVLEKVHISDGDWYIDDYEIAPTHWMPLPLPPEEKA